MKYAFMSFSTPELDLGQMLEKARQYGYDGIEPRAEQKHRHGVELEASAAQRQAIRDQAQRAGVALCCLAVSRRYADPAEADEQIKTTHGLIDLAGDIGAPRLRVFGGKYPEQMTREQAVETVVTAFRAVADHAGERGVRICMETHDAWCDPGDVAEVMRRVNHPAIAVNWDIMHPVRRAGYTMDRAFEVLRQWVAHTHVHDGDERDGKSRIVPIGSGQIDHRRALQLLKQSGYDGYISGEWMAGSMDPDFAANHLEQEIKALQRIEQEFG